MIGLFNDSYPPVMDGVALTVQNYAKALHKKNQRVCVVTPRAPKYADSSEYPVYRYASLPLPVRKPYCLGIPYADFPFQAMIKKIPFSLLHVHCPFSSAKVALTLKKQQKAPIIATFHSKFRADFERIFNNRQITDWMLKEVIRFFESADEVWIPQAAVEDTIREYGYRGKVIVMENGTDFPMDSDINALKRQSRQELNIPNGLPVFLFTGQHIWEKNTGLIIDTLALMNNLQFKMYFIGTGYAEKELKAMANKYGLDSKVEFLGTIFDRKKLKSYYAAADLFLFPSLYDNAPLVLREASSQYTPSVLVRDSTASEVIIDNYNGFLTENSSQAMAKRVMELIGKPETLKQAGLNASKTIARSWDDVAEEVLDRYFHLIRKHAETH
ncbi:MAG: glycosyltransferase [Dysgonamonadaceae bacterium]|nr:glycosyltransferase [Dysgonamonadaceae bacterium]